MKCTQVLVLTSLCCLQVSYEKKQLQQLNESLAGAGRRLAQSAWTTSQQRDNLEVGLSATHSHALSRCVPSSMFLLNIFLLLPAGPGDVPGGQLAPALLPAGQPPAPGPVHRRLQAPLPPNGQEALDRDYLDPPSPRSVTASSWQLSGRTPPWWRTAWLPATVWRSPT